MREKKPCSILLRRVSLRVQGDETAVNRKSNRRCRPQRLLLHTPGIKKIMAGQRTLAAAVLLTLAMSLCCSCSGKTETKQNRQQLLAQYCQTIGEDADAYFTELSEISCGIRPERIYYSIPEDTSDEILAAEPLTWQEMLETGDPRLIVGLHKKPEVQTDNDAYSEREIRQVLKEVLSREMILDLYFDNEHRIYRIEQDGRIIVEEAEGADGGAYRNTYEYDVRVK